MMQEEIQSPDGHDESYMDKKEAAALLGIQPVTLWLWRRLGLLHPIWRNGQPLYQRSQLEILQRQPSLKIFQ